MPVIQHLGTAIGSGDDTLVLHLDASNSSSYPGSGSTWTDLSGQGNHVTLTGTTYSSSNGGYLIFDGNNDYGTVPAIDLTSTQFTLSIWTFIQDYYQNTSLELVLLLLLYNLRIKQEIQNGHDMTKS